VPRPDGHGSETRTYGPGEFHAFTAAGKQFLYLVPSGGIFEIDDAVRTVIERVGQSGASHDDLMRELAGAGLRAGDAEGVIDELYRSRALVSGEMAAEPVPNPPADFPLQTLVLNLTNQCNLSCQYCYEFGADKVATPEGKPKFMDFETAKASVDLLLQQSAGRRSVHITFFGGETLMNFPLLQKVVGYAKRAGCGAGARGGFQPDDQRHAADAGDHQISFREPDRRYGQHGRAEGNARSAARVFERPRQLRHR